MDTIGMDSYPFIAAAAAAVIVVPEQDRVLLVGRRKGNPPPRAAFRPAVVRQTTVKPATCARLAYFCSLRDNPRYRAAFTRRNHPTGDPHDHRRQRPADRPPPARVVAGPECSADQGVASALEAILSDNTRRVYGIQWWLFNEWCDSVGLTPLPAEPLTVARYLAVRAGSGASIATMRLASSAIAKAHQWAGHESPCRDPGVRASSKGWRRRLARPQRQAGALTADVLAVIRLTAVQPRKRGRRFETAEQAAERVRFDLALVAVLSDAGLRSSQRLRLSPGATSSAGTTALAVSP